MTGATVVTDRSDFRAVARDAPPGTRIPVEVQLPVADPFDAYRRARDRDGRSVFLETSGGQSGWGYFGVDPVEVLTVGSEASLTRTDCGAAASGQSGPKGGPDAADSPTLAALQGRLDAEALVRGDCEVPYPCGAVGWLSYDVARELETLPGDAVDDRGLPRLQVAVFDRLAAWECPAGEPATLRITACPRVGGSEVRTAAADDRAEAGPEDDSEAAPDASDEPAPDARVEPAPEDRGEPTPTGAYDRGRRRALELAARIRDGDPGVGPAPAPADVATFESDCGRAAYADRVRAVKAAVREGETFQANVSQRLTAPAAVHPVAAFDALRRVNPAPYSALLELPAADLVSASPELLLEREADRLRTEPIAGTRPRGDSLAADDALEAELTTDEKERAEHAMLVDLERNDLGKVATYGSVEVTEYRRVDRYSEVMHLVSLVEGRLREGASLADAIAAVFPGGTITGAPKPRTMELIDELEGTRRGPYTGSIGVFGFDGRATLNIVIRTLVRHADRYHLRVGAGVVHDSVPEREYRETLDKARALVNAVDRALGERAELAVEDDPDDGVGGGGEGEGADGDREDPEGEGESAGGDCEDAGVDGENADGGDLA